MTTELHPCEVLLLAGLALADALLTVLRLLVLPTLALLLVLVMPRRRAARRTFAEEAPAAPPAPARPVTPAPCLADLAADLLALPAAQLRELAGTRRRLPKRELAALICAMPL